RIHAATAWPVLLYGRSQPTKTATVRPDYGRGGAVERSKDPPSATEPPDGPHSSGTHAGPRYHPLSRLVQHADGGSSVVHPAGSSCRNGGHYRTDRRSSGPIARRHAEEEGEGQESQENPQKVTPQDYQALPLRGPPALPSPLGQCRRRRRHRGQIHREDVLGPQGFDLVLSGPAGVTGCQGHERCRQS